MIFCVHFACPPVSPSVAGRHLYVRLMRSRGSVARRTRKNKPARQCQPAASPTPTAAKVAAQSRTAYVADAHTGLKNRLTHAFSVLPALPSCFARGNECAAAAKPVTTSSEACPMCKVRTVAPLSICANHPLHTPAMFACRRLVGACRAHTVVVKMCASTCCWREDLCGVPPPPPLFFFFFFPMLQLFRPKWNGCTVVVLRTVVQHAFCLATRFRAVHGRRLTSGQAGYCSQIVPAQRNSRFHKTKLCAVDWK